MRAVALPMLLDLRIDPMKPKNLLLLLRRKKEAPTDLRRLGLDLVVLLGLYIGMEYLGLWGFFKGKGTEPTLL